MKILNLFLFAGMIVMNYLANALPLNNKTTGELSDSFPNLFVPAGVTFSIWGIIYILLLSYCIVQFTASGRVITGTVSLLFGLTCIFNALWIVAWHYQKLPLSLLLMAGLLLSLIFINLYTKELNPGLIKAAFGVYLGWICIATIANVTALLVDSGWNGAGLSQVAWTIIMISAGTLIVVAAVLRISNPYIGLAVIWALSGIIIKRSDDHRTIVFAAAAAIAVVAIATVMAFLRRA